MSKKTSSSCLIALVVCGMSGIASCQDAGRTWGPAIAKLRAEDAKRGQLFADGNYAMFIHWGLYSQLANKVDGKTYYGIGEWIMHKRMAGIPVADYQKLAKTFNPTRFDGAAIARPSSDSPHDKPRLRCR